MAKRYQGQIPEKAMFDVYLEMSEDRGQVLFQQEGAPSHRAKTTLRWLQLNEVQWMPHPAASQDLSPIKPLWHTFKQLI